jgi:hypothetical protein
MNGEACCRPAAKFCRCPACGQPAKPVSALTLERHIAAELRARLGESAGFCANPDCEVVYCAPNDATVHKGEMATPVTLKDAGDEVPVCYCFGFKRGDLLKDLESDGKTDIPGQIRKGIKDGLCDCERKNPQGVCCLGNVATAIKAIASTLLARRK